MKKLLIVFLLLILLVTGCGGGASPADVPAEPPQNESPAGGESPAGSETPIEVETPPDTGAGGADPGQPDALIGLIKDEYPGIEISADVLERKALLPGKPIPVTVVIENKGDKSVFYVQGSGSFETPEALFLWSVDLQPVIPKDRLGIVTADFVTPELRPGDRLLFKLNMMAIQPNANFDAYTHELFGEDVYITDMEWPALQERFPKLTAVSSGTYTISAFFLYTPAGEDDPAALFGGASGYAQADCVVGITE